MRLAGMCFTLATLGLPACTSGTIDDAAAPAPFPAPPQVQDFGGPVLAHPAPVPIFFAQDASNQAFVASVSDFTRTVTTSAYFTGAVAEYGVAAGSARPAVHLTEAAPTTIDDTAIKTWIAAAIAAGTLPEPDADTIEVLYYPAGTTVTQDGAASCTVFAGYHDSAPLADGIQVPYAVIPRCDASVASATSAASHEIAEASTDPYPHSSPAYAQVDLADYVWEATLGGGEIADLCAPFPDAFTTFPSFPYRVQRVWSNEAARNGRDPCQPEVPNEIYVGAAPLLPDMSTLDVGGQSISVKSVNIAVGGHLAIPVDLFSEAPTGPFTIDAVDVAASSGAAPLLELTLSATTGVNGDVPTLDIHVLQASPNGLELFYVRARRDANPSDTTSPAGIWLGVVTN